MHIRAIVDVCQKCVHYLNPSVPRLTRMLTTVSHSPDPIRRDRRRESRRSHPSSSNSCRRPASARTSNCPRSATCWSRPWRSYRSHRTATQQRSTMKCTWTAATCRDRQRTNNPSGRQPRPATVRRRNGRPLSRCPCTPDGQCPCWWRWCRRDFLPSSSLLLSWLVRFSAPRIDTRNCNRMTADV